MKFVCLGYIAPSSFEHLPKDQQERLMNECFDYDDELRRGKHFLGGEALQPAQHAVTLRANNGAIEATDGPYAETKEMLGGILLLEADDLDHAVALMSLHPGVKLGPFEIRPADQNMNALIAQRDRAVRIQGEQNDLEKKHPLELNISRLVDPSPEHLYRCWTEPQLLTRWFTPSPWKTVGCDIDLRPGGAFNARMMSPDGQAASHNGVFLEIVPNRKLVFTDALLPGWMPSEKPFVVATVTFEKEGPRTRYTARVCHWTEADVASHLERGFYMGWNQALDQLIEVARTLD